MARTLRYWLILLFSSISGLALAQNGSIYGTIIDEAKDPVPNAQVFVSSGGIQQGAVVTDFDGNFVVKPLSAGTYDVRVNYSGYKSEIVEGISVSISGGVAVNFELEPSSNPANANTTGTGTGTGTSNTNTGGGRVNSIGPIEVKTRRHEVPLINPDRPGSETILLAKDIERMPTRNPLDNASTAPGVYQGRSGGGLSIGGGRGENTLYVVDGIVQVGSRGIANLPFGSIDQMSVITGGLPARYGDATGGVVNITTKGVTKDLQGSLGAEHSVDGFNNRQAYFSLSGPLLSRKDSVYGELRKRPIIGFSLNGNFIQNQDAAPSYYGNYVAKESVRTALEAAPLVAVQGTQGFPTLRNATEFLTEDDFEVVKRRPRAATTNGSLLGKLDFQLGNNMNLTLGGQGFYGEGDNYSRRLIQFSPDAISRSTNFTGRGFVRFTQRFPSKSGDSDRVISNAFYSVQADYQKETNNTEDPRFGRDIFKYGYLGKFTQQNIETFSVGTDSVTGLQRLRLNPGFFGTNARFERSELNPVLANYTSAVYDLIGESNVSQGDIRNIRSFNGLLNGDQPTWTFGDVFSNVGQWQSGYGFSNNDQISVGVDASLDLKSRKTTHSLEFGLYYQQRTERSYNLDASLSDRGGVQSLWERAFQLTNTHFDENFDYKNPLVRKNGEVLTLQQLNDRGLSINTNDTFLYNYAVKPNQQSLFDLNLRRKLGIANPETDTRYINVYELDPTLLSVDMFSADELFNAGRSHVRYFGYDHMGNRLTGSTTFNDFFTAVDADGRRTRPVGAFQPNYIAGYLSDNFKYRDIRFNVGVRVDRYDANTKVLRDPYSLYAVRNAGDVNPAGRPANIGDDYVVYIDNNNSSAPVVAGYRNGDDWYNPQGVFVDDPGFLKEFTGGTDPQPFLQDKDVEITDTGTKAFDPNTSFVDYTPQVNVMPRLSFSFPIAEQSFFYAHYNIVVQRPRLGVALSPLDYYFLQTNPTRIINNPNLRPERNTDYEVGFTQVLTKQSSITLSAFYKERKDQIQIRPYLYAWPITYYTYGNRDFSTTKGLRAKYDLRRVGPFLMTVSYTLQFVEGTGSDAADQNGGRTDVVSGTGVLRDFIAAQLPNLRFPFALAYDSRHNFVINADYRYSEYDPRNPSSAKDAGPKMFGKYPLQNTGANIILRTRSGEPYTRYADPVSNTIQGGVNGARLPWHFTLDANLDKDFALRPTYRKTADGIGDAPATYSSRRPLYINAFVYVKNILNRREILGVYGFTGSPDDNGYLNFPAGQQAALQQLSPEAYADQYTIGNLDPNNFNLPRQINVGLRMNF